MTIKTTNSTPIPAAAPPEATILDTVLSILAGAPDGAALGSGNPKPIERRAKNKLDGGALGRSALDVG
jgi:hypothetical protein